MGAVRWLTSKKPACQCKRCRCHPWVRRSHWRRKWQPTPVFLPRESHGRRSLLGYSPWGRNKWDTTERLSTHNGSRGGNEGTREAEKTGGEGERPCVGVRGRNRATITEEEDTAPQGKFSPSTQQKAKAEGDWRRSPAKFRGNGDTEGEEV